MRISADCFSESLNRLRSARVRRRRVLGLLDDPDHLVDVIDGDLQAFEDVLAILGAFLLERRPAGDDRVAVLDEVPQQLLQVHFLRHAVRESQHDRAEGHLHLRMPVQLIQDHHRDGVPLQLDHQPHALFVGLVTDVGNAFELLGERQVANLLVDPLRAHLVGELGDDDLLLACGLFFLHQRSGANHDPPPPLLVALLDPFAPVDDAARGEVGSLDEFPQVLHAGVGVVDQVGDGPHRLHEVVWRDVGGHAHRDPRRAVDDEIREPAGEHGGLAQPVVEVGDEVDGFLVDVRQHRHGDARQAGFRVAVRRRGIAVDRAEVPLPIHERVAQRERLDHAHEGVVQGHVAVRVILAQHVAHHRRAFLVGPAGHETELVHGVEDAAVNGLETVAHVRQRALHDHAHRIVEEGLADLVLDEPRQDAFALDWTGHVRSRRPVSGVRRRLRAETC